MTQIDSLRMAASLVAIVAVIFALAWVVRRVGWLRPQGAQNLNVLSMQSLGASRASVALVQWDGTQLLLGVTATHVNVLHTVSPPARARPLATGQPPSFQTVLDAQQEQS